VVQSVESQRDWVDVFNSIAIDCLAYDPDGDELNYQWSSNGGAISGEGSSITWTAPDNTGSYTTTVVVSDGRGGEATASLAVDVRLNRPPVIGRLSAESTLVRAGASITIECLAFDPDGDELDYRWSEGSGAISGEGSSVVWTAANKPGGSNVIVTVSDGRGGEVSAALSIRVQANEPPVIEGLSAGLSSVRAGASITIECLASDPEGDELSYQWSASGGIISGEGSSVTWTAPTLPGTYVITVEVSDGRDAVGSPKLLRLEVLPNEPPIIDSLKTEEMTVLLGRSTVIRCEASDPDGDELTYWWTATGGELSGKGPEVNWTALGGCGDRVTISVSVTDGYGGESSEEMTIKVRAPG